MSNPVYFIFALILAYAYPTGVEPLRFARDPKWAALATALALAIVAIASFAVYRRPERVRRLGLAKMALKILALVLYAALLFVFHWRLLVWIGLEDVFLLDDLATLAPFLAMAAVHGWMASGADAKLRGDGATGAGLRTFAFRTFLGFSFLPIFLLIVVQGRLLTWEPVLKTTILYPFVGWGIVLALIVAFLALSPLYLRLVFRGAPIPPGPKRARMEALARRSGFRCRELLLLDTGGSKIANAFIVGLHPSLRYVFFTDALYDGMTEEELECVMAHEMTHALRKHLLYYLCFSIAFLILLLFLQEFMLGGAAGGVAALLVSLGSAFAFWVLLFGFVSRRFETEADLVGMKLAFPEPQPGFANSRRFGSALYRVAALNRMPADLGSWRHWSVQIRSYLLLEAEARPESGLRHERACSAIRSACLMGLFFALFYGVFLVRGQLRRLPEARKEWAAVEKAMDGWRALRRGDAEAAIPPLEDVTREPQVRGELLLILAEAYEKAGRPREAEDARRRAVERGLTDPRARLEAGGR